MKTLKIGLISFLAFFFFMCSAPIDKENNDNVVKEIQSELKEIKDYAEKNTNSKTQGGIIYVPVYSFLDDVSKMSGLLSLRNISTSKSFRIIEVDLYDTDGQLIEEFIKEPLVLNKLVTKDYKMHRNDLRAGRGGNYIVKWEADENVIEPLIEMVHYGTIGTHSFSFISKGVSIQ